MALTRGQVAHLSGLDIETVRFYEKQGLIDEPPRSDSGYRQYSEQDVSRLRLIKRAKELGFSLKEIADLLELQVNPKTGSAEVRAQAEAKIADIDEKIADLTKMRATLATLTEACSGEGATTECPIIEALNAPDGGVT
ncbi:MAG: MerR family DNA-binding protein [Truepera sp.]|nr:MerR family DNA-binding protein [Truepera sp.]